MEVKKPIFIIGLGRSGSTVFFDILSNHPDLVWLSRRICNRYPGKPEHNRLLMNYINYPILGKVLRRYFEPGECYPYWDNLFRGFSNPYRDLQSQDVTSIASRCIKSSLSTIVKHPKDRLLIKITGWNRMRFLKEVFPDSLFIHVTRDHRAVINSFMNVYFWPGWNGPHQLFMGGLNDDQKGELERFNHSFVALAGMKLEAQMDAYHRAKAVIPSEQLFEVSYEKLCGAPEQLFQETCAFCGIEWCEALKQAVKRSHLRNSNNKWREYLTESQQDIAQYYFNKLSNKYSAPV